MKRKQSLYIVDIRNAIESVMNFTNEMTFDKSQKTVHSAVQTSIKKFK